LLWLLTLESRTYFLQLDKAANDPQIPVQQPNGLLQHEEPVNESNTQNHSMPMIIDDDDETGDFRPYASSALSSNMPVTRRSTRLSSQASKQTSKEPVAGTSMQSKQASSPKQLASQVPSSSDPSPATDKLEGKLRV
jgi:TFIIF-interacting CTD phosphatase-like protein